MKEKVFALIDGNNFFVSCERIFAPDLDNKPVLVLSNNDGCVVARSNEVKALGIKMGVPLFEVEKIVNENNVKVFSSNFSLYGSISNRLAKILKSFCNDIEVYSIDESFLEFTNLKLENFTEYTKYIKKSVHKNIGIPISIGIAKTKTLAKVANRVAKKNTEFDGVLNFNDMSEDAIDEFLKKMDVADVWGIGRQITIWMISKGIKTAYDLKYADIASLRKVFGVNIAKTISELRGISCYSLDKNPKPKKSIASTRSFGRKILNFNELVEPVSLYTSRVSEKLRSQKSLTSQLYVFIHTSRYKDKSKRYYNGKWLSFDYTDYTPDLIKIAIKGLREIYESGFSYAKAGIILSGIIPKSHLPLEIFDNEQKLNHINKKDTINKSIDEINKRWGSGSIFPASQGTKMSWRMKSQKRSKRFTTEWTELLEVK